MQYVYQCCIVGYKYTKWIWWPAIHVLVAHFTDSAYSSLSSSLNVSSFKNALHSNQLIRHSINTALICHRFLSDVKKKKSRLNTVKVQYHIFTWMLRHYRLLTVFHQQVHSLWYLLWRHSAHTQIHLCVWTLSLSGRRLCSPIQANKW